MLKRRVMALVLAVSMVLGNTATAWAAEPSVPASTDGETMTVNEDGGTEITSDEETDSDESSGENQLVDSDADQGGSGTSDSQEGSDTGSDSSGTTTGEDSGVSSGEGSQGAGTDSSTPSDSESETVEGSGATEENATVEGDGITDEKTEGTDQEPSLDVPEEESEEKETDAEETDSVSDNELSVSMNTLEGRNYLSEGDVDYSTYKIVVQNKEGIQKGGYDTLLEATEFIYSAEANDTEYDIILQGDVSVEKGSDEQKVPLQFGNINKKVNLYLSGHDLTLLNNTPVLLNSINGKSPEGAEEPAETKGRIILPANGGTAFWCSSGSEAMTFTDVDFVASNTMFQLGTIDSPNKGDEPCYANFILTNVDVKGTVSYLLLYGDIEWESSATLNVTNIQVTTIRQYYNEFTSETIDQEIHLSMPVVTSNLGGKGADLRVADLTVNNQATLYTDRRMIVEPGGEVKFKNLQINSSLAENMDEDTANDIQDKKSFIIELQRKVELSTGDNVESPTFEAAQELETRAAVSISGTVSKGANVYYPIQFLKYNCWEASDSDEKNLEVFFEENEVIATVTNSAVGATNFSLSDEDEDRYVEKTGTSLKAEKRTIDVIAQMGTEEITYRYGSLEGALTSLEKDFGKFTGSYIFLFHDDVTLTRNSVIPACVKEAYLATGEYGTDIGGSWQGSGSYHLRTLNLQGYTLESKGSVTLAEGLRITSKDEGGQNTAKAATLKVATELYIDESASLMEKKSEEGWTAVENAYRPAVLANTNVSIPTGEVILRTKDEMQKPEDGWLCYIESGSVTAADVIVDEGCWKIDRITTTNMRIEGVKEKQIDAEGGVATETYLQAEATLIANNIIVNKGRVDVYGNICQRLSGSTETGDNPVGVTPDSVMTLNGAKLYIGSLEAEIEETVETFYGRVNLALLTVNSAYAQESVNDWTIENSGLLYANTINMKAGTFYNHFGRTIVNKANLINLENGEDSSFIVNTLSQTGKVWFLENSRLMVNVEGKLNNITLGDRNGNGEKEDKAYLGRGSNGKIILGGTFTPNAEEQKLSFMVSDTYLEIAKLEDNGTDLTRIKADGSDALELNKGTDGSDAIAFYVASAKTVFPVDSIEILQPTDQADTLPTAVYQSGTEIRVINKYVRLYAADLSKDGEATEESHIKDFTTWKECITYLTTIGNTNTTYIINTTEEINVGGALTLPKNVGGLTIRGTVKGEEKTKLISGNITLTTNTIFEDIDLSDNITINTGGKEVTFKNVKTSFTKITGTSATTINIEGGQITVLSPLTGIGRVNVVNDGVLIVNGNFTVSTLELDGGTLDINGEKTVATVSKELILKNKASIDTQGTIKLANIITYTNAASFKYNNIKAPGLSITGSITSLKEDGSDLNLDDVYAVTNKVDEEVKNYTIQKDVPTGDQTYKIIKENSISLELEEVIEDTSLVTAPQISASWFVLTKDVEAETVAQITYKTGTVIKSAGEAKTYDVILQQIVWEEKPLIDSTTDKELETLKTQAVYYNLDSFETLQEAFTEIDRMNNMANEYRILLKGSDEHLVKSKAANYTFPTKAARVWIEGEMDGIQLIYASDITVKANTNFENLELKPKAASGKLNLGNFEVVLSETTFTTDKITVAGGGLTRGSYLKIDNGGGNTGTMKLAAISNVGTLWLSGMDVEVAGATSVNTLKMANNSASIFETFTGLGAISVKDIISTKGNTIQTLPIYTYTDKTKSVIKAIASRLTITGRIEITDYIDGGDTLNIEVLTEDQKRLNAQGSRLTEDFLKKTGIPLAKAINVDTTFVDFIGAVSGSGGIYKKSGVLLYTSEDVFVTLEYNVVEGDDRTKVSVNCATFKDAVTEINNLRAKRAYTMIFQGAGLEDITLEALTMPNKNYISHLTMRADGSEVFYKGNITFTSNVTLEDINFVQATVVSGVNERIEDAAAQGLPAAITINTGGFNLEFAEGKETDGGAVELNRVSFNTPILLNGGGKGTLTLHESVELLAGDIISFNDNNTRLGEVREEESLSQIRGRITNFATVSIDQDVDLLGWPAWNTKTKVEVYTAAELNVTALDISQNQWVEIGNDYYTDKIIVKNLTLSGGELYVTGSGTFTNVTLAGDSPVLSVTSPTPIEDEAGNVSALPACYFAVLGTVANTAYGATLETGLSAKAGSALTISGTVVLEDAEEKINIKVSVPPELLGDDATVDSVITLGSEPIYTTDQSKPAYTLASTLLTAKNADERAFLADESCIGNVDAYEFDSENGYILKKTGSVISVYYGDQIGAALYVVEGEDSEEFYNYYPTLPDAIAAIEALKNTNADYRIEVLQTVKKVGTTNTPIALSMPKNAKHVTIMSNTKGNGTEAEPAQQLILTDAVTLGCDTSFQNVEFVNTKTSFATKGFDLELINLESYTDENRENRSNTIDLGKIDGGKSGEVTLVSDGKTYQFTNDVTNMSKLTLENADLNVNKGNLITSVLLLKNAEITMVSKVATIKDVYNLGSEANKITYSRNTSNKQPNLNITGDIYHADEAQNLVLELSDQLTQQMGVANAAGTYTLIAAAELVNLDKAAMDKLAFRWNGQDITDVAWAGKGVYWMPDALKDKKITVSWNGADLDEEILEPSKEKETAYTATCLDLTQASTYIGNRADKTESYTINVSSDIADTSVTDKVAVSALTLPAKDKAESIILDGKPDGEDKSATIYFSGNITANGSVKFTDLILANKANFAVTNVKNSDIVQNRVLIASGLAELTFDNVSYASDTADATYGKISNITGTKGWTQVNLSGKDLEMTGGLTNVKALIAESMLTTRGKSGVTTFKLMEGGAWKAMGVTTIGDVEISATGEVSEEKNFIATTYSVNNKKESTGLPVLTITGKIYYGEENKTGGVPVKVFDPLTQKELGVTEGESDPAVAEQEKAYNGAKLVIATKESADKFIASPYVRYEEGKGYVFKDSFESAGSYQAIKDAKNYVSNGDISGMEVKLISDSEVTYVKTYAEAIQIINTIGDKTASYTIALRKTVDNDMAEGDEVAIYTAVDKNGEPVEGALALPGANKAAELTITQESEEVTLKFTGTIAPKTNLAFTNITLTEIKKNNKGGYDDLNTVALNAGTYEVTFGEGVKTANSSVKSGEITRNSENEETFFSLDDETATEYQMIFSSISGSKASEIKMGVSAVYVEKDINISQWHDSSASMTGESVIAAGGNIKITGKLYGDDTSGEIAIKGKKAIFIEMVEKAKLDIDTCYTAAAWKKAVSQLTLNDIYLDESVLADTEAMISVNLYVYDTQTKEYSPISVDQLEALLITEEEKPATWKKLFTASKMSLPTNDGSVSGGIVITGAEAYNLTKYEGGVYLTEEENGIEVVGTIPNQKDETTIEPETIYEGYFLSWEQAIKEIDRQNKKDDQGNYADYTITVLNTQDEYTPIKAVTMPSKANTLLIKGVEETDGENITGLVTTTGTITLKCDTTFENIHLAAVKKSGNGYYTAQMTLNAGNFELKLVDIPDENEYAGLDNFKTQIALIGGAKGTADIDPLYEDTGRVHGEGITQITRLGTVILGSAEPIESNKDNSGGRTVQKTDYLIKNGISGVTTLKIEEGVYVDCRNKDVSVKNLKIGKAVGPEGDNYPNNPNQSSLQAKNITVTGMTTMASARLKAGTTAIGDGKIILTNVVFCDMHNHLEGKQDKKGNSLIQIKGTVEAGIEEEAKISSVVPSWNAATISLTMNNSGIIHAKLAEGMTFLTAPKAETSWFRPYYSAGDGANMGMAISKIIEKAVEGSDGEDKYDDLYGLYKSGSYIKFGKIKGIESINEDDGTANLYDIAEVHVFSHSACADDTYGKHPYTTYMTFEEAVNGINSMALQKEIEAANGKKTKVNADYTMEVLRDVEIGNTRGDGKYTALTLPTKVSELTVLGGGNSIFFSGNITLRSNITLDAGIIFTPMKAVKGGAQPTITNISAGNFKLTFAGADVADRENMFDENGDYLSLINNLTGGAKGELIINPYGGIKAVNVTGFNKVIFAGNGVSNTAPDTDGQTKTIYEILEVTGKMNVKTILAEKCAIAALSTGQGLTANIIGVKKLDTVGDIGESQQTRLTIESPAAIPMKLNGGRLSEVGGEAKNTGSVYNDTGIPIELNVTTQSGAILDGTKIITGKYLSISDWKVSTLEKDSDTVTVRNIYQNGNDLYLGGLYIQ